MSSKSHMNNFKKANDRKNVVSFFRLETLLLSPNIKSSLLGYYHYKCKYRLRAAEVCCISLSQKKCVINRHSKDEGEFHGLERKSV